MFLFHTDPNSIQNMRYLMTVFQKIDFSTQSKPSLIFVFPKNISKPIFEPVYTNYIESRVVQLRSKK